MDTREASFLDQTVRFHAAGGDLDAPVRVRTDEKSGGVRINHSPNQVTRLYFAAQQGWCSSISFLLNNGADVDLGWPSRDLTPLHTAAQSASGRFNAAVLLLDAGARVDDRDGEGLTALHISARKKLRAATKLCKLLLSRGASLDVRDNRGRDPEAVARYHGNATLADLFAAVRAAGGWPPYVDAPRKELLALRQRLPALRERGRAASSSRVRLHERLFLDAPGDVFRHVLRFWRSDRDD